MYTVVVSGLTCRANLCARNRAKSRAALNVQGRYIGYLRHLKPRQEAQVRKVREAKEVRAARSPLRRGDSG